MSLSKRGFPRSYPIAQPPNAPALAFGACWVVAALTDGTVHDVARGGFYAAFAVWAAWELADGVNAFRRVLGAGGLVYVAAGVFL